jgi:putative hydrolase of the HAD superfamily
VTNEIRLPRKITTLFMDVGGVMLTNGWDRRARKLAAEKFNLDLEELNERHHLSFDTYEEGKLTLDQYLDQVIFYESRSFSRPAFKDFMYAQSQPLPEMLTLMRTVKAKNPVRIVVVSNEGRELTTHRVRTFELDKFVDAFIVSSFVHFRKPDQDIYKIALDVSQTSPHHVLYFDDRPLFVQIAGQMGIYAVLHTSYETTRQAMIDHGLEV